MRGSRGIESDPEPGPLDGRPHQTVSVLAPRTPRASWTTPWRRRPRAVAPDVRGAPAHDAAVRSHRPQYLTANFDQSSQPLGSRTTGLFSKGPYLDWLATVVHRVKVTGLRALGRPEPVQSTVTVGANTSVTGTQTKSSTQHVGGTVVYGHSHPKGPGVTGNYGLTWRPWWRSESESETVTRTVTTETSWSDGGYKVLAAGDAEHQVAAEVRSVGLLSPLGRLLQQWHNRAGRWQRIKGGWLGHIPERTAAEMGLVPGDDLGAGPTYAAGKWTQPGWLRRNPFATYPVNSLNVTRALDAFDQKVADLGFDDDSREAVRGLVSGRVLRALRREMAGPGSSLTARIGGPGWKSVRIGKRDVRVRARLVPVEDGQDFDQLWPGTELDETRTAVETRTRGFDQGRGADAGTTLSEGVHTGNEAVPVAGPSLTETGSNRQTLSGSTGTTLTRARSATTSGPHAQFTTRYQLQLTLEVGRKRGDRPRDPASARISHQEDVGALKDIVPLSLLRPDTTDTRTDAEPDPLAPPEIADEPAAVNVLTSATERIPAEELWDRLHTWRSIPSGTARTRRSRCRPTASTSVPSSAPRASRRRASSPWPRRTTTGSPPPPGS
ncbi:hypothetical protein NKH77_28710 [Streptomyces sp. M19]